MARFAARSMIFRPRTDELAPRASVRTHVYQDAIVESGLDAKRARKRDGEKGRKETDGGKGEEDSSKER